MELLADDTGGQVIAVLLEVDGSTIAGHFGTADTYAVLTFDPAGVATTDIAVHSGSVTLASAGGAIGLAVAMARGGAQAVVSATPGGRSALRVGGQLDHPPESSGSVHPSGRRIPGRCGCSLNEKRRVAGSRPSGSQ